MYTNYQPNLDRINSQIAELEKLRTQMQQPPAINQTFQLSSDETIRFANSLDEVEARYVRGDTPYFSRDMSVVWVKTPKGNIKTYELTEIIPKDDKDMQIEFLKSQIEELRKEVRRNDATTTNDVTKQDTTDSTRDDETDGESTKKKKSTSI
ncbi:MAG: hypothetical protein J6S67_10855 [Methanobrevibacter sp.]|nr:hypothetical protein [Methanobrevibacter sp.]